MPREINHSVRRFKSRVMFGSLSSKDWRSGARFIPIRKVSVDDSRDEVDDFFRRLTDFVRDSQTSIFALRSST